MVPYSILIDYDFLECINDVIEINISTISIIWHTSYTTFFEYSVYSFVSYSSVEFDNIW